MVTKFERGKEYVFDMKAYGSLISALGFHDGAPVIVSVTSDMLGYVNGHEVIPEWCREDISSFDPKKVYTLSLLKYITKQPEIFPIPEWVVKNTYHVVTLYQHFDGTYKGRIGTFSDEVIPEWCDVHYFDPKESYVFSASFA